VGVSRAPPIEREPGLYSWAWVETGGNTHELAMMHVLQGSYRGLSLLLDLNWDRAFFAAAIAAALSAGAFVASL